MNDRVKEIRDHMWSTDTIRDGWFFVPRSSWRWAPDLLREGPEKFRVEKWDASDKFKTDEEALDYVMTSSSEICQYVQEVLLQQLFWDT